MLSIRTAVTAEKLVLEALQLRASIAWEEYRAQILADPGAIDVALEALAQGRVSIAERDRTMLGFCVVLRRSDGDADLDGLFVDPNVWREGVGARLVRAAEERAVADRAKLLHVIANPRAEAFYVACGFTYVGEEPTTFGRARTMKKQLHAADEMEHCNE